MTEAQVGGAGVEPGFDAARKVLRNYWETFEDFHAEIEEVIHADEEQVVARVRDSGRLSGSDSEVSNRFFEVWTFREGRIVRVSIHTETEPSKPLGCGSRRCRSRTSRSSGE